ncbi:DUF6310 domain-containing protein [Pyxidicoccus sp. MSG2]|uniref:DUF6310 domain-containing protein n=1 Tax=Pyxidicoccus sp. MSG2 TaxID=2996790 RepID=UPI00226FF65D|nr:DUF6310 domain-containing protein [Pyxidicoccus sp. MSG2]MCY1018904.1 DUF6310 domain-containing protein [Pyxidicoccus sp. MSG2]
MTLRFRASVALLLFLSACATSAPSPRESAVQSPRRANLQRAAALPWRDEGRCVVREASQPWPVLAERCFHALDHDRVRFKDPTGRCAVATTGAAALGIGLCALAAPEIVVGAVIVIGAVMAAVLIKEALDAYELRGSRAEETEHVPQLETAQSESSANRKLRPEPSGQDVLPPVPTGPLVGERHAECTPRRVPHLGGNDLHNRCADRIPRNDFSGWDALVNGKNFDGLQLRERVLWEVKTDKFDTYPPDLRGIVTRNQVNELRRERELARACGFDFRVGVRSPAHQTALEVTAPELEGIIVVMEWC